MKTNVKSAPRDYVAEPSSVAAPKACGVEVLAVPRRSAFDGVVKSIRVSNHALRYLTKRGFTVAEVEEAIRTARWQPAELERLNCRKDFPYGKEWNGKVYATKQVRPVFVEEATEIVVVTVYTYYF
jgi:hypothetical protein